MTNGPGFYKDLGDGEGILYAPNRVIGPNVTLLTNDRATYVYPVKGWTWFDSEVAARTALALPSLLRPPAFPPASSGVTAFQLREALRLTPDPLGGRGTLLDAVEVYVSAHTAGNPRLRNAWDWIDPWERDSPLVLGLGEAFGMSPKNIDALFVLAATIRY